LRSATGGGPKKRVKSRHSGGGGRGCGENSSQTSEAEEISTLKKEGIRSKGEAQKPHREILRIRIGSRGVAMTGGRET